MGRTMTIFFCRRTSVQNAVRIDVAGFDQPRAIGDGSSSDAGRRPGEAAGLAVGGGQAGPGGSRRRSWRRQPRLAAVRRRKVHDNLPCSKAASAAPGVGGAAWRHQQVVAASARVFLASLMPAPSRVSKRAISSSGRSVNRRREFAHVGVVDVRQNCSSHTATAVRRSARPRPGRSCPSCRPRRSSAGGW